MQAIARGGYLYKSRLIIGWKWPKKLHLEKHHSELGDVLTMTEIASTRTAKRSPSLFVDA